MLRHFRRLTLSEHAPELHACWAFANALLAQKLIENDGLPARPYISQAVFGDDFGGGIYSYRNNHLSDLLTATSLGQYAPGFALFVKLDMEGRLVDIADDIALMLLRQAASAWTERDDRMSPIARSDLDQLIVDYEARLDEDQLGRVEEFWETREPLQRLYLGDEQYFIWLEEEAEREREGDE